MEEVGLYQASYPLQARLWWQHLGDLQGEVSAQNNDFASRNDAVAHQQVDRLIDVTIQFQHRSRADLKRLAQQHLAAAEVKPYL